MPKPQRFIFASDNHGDMGDRNAIRALREFMRTFKADVRIHGGDCFDLRCLRRGAGEDEQSEDLRADLDAGMEFMTWFKPTHWLRGNHDERLTDAINSPNPVLRRFASLAWEEVMDVVGSRCEVLPYCKRRGVLKLGSLAFVHGFTAGMFAAKRLAEIYGNVCGGHTHAIDAFSIPGLEPRIGRCCGCLAKLDMPYNRAHLNTLRQSHGFAFGFSYADGTHRVYQAQPINGVWVFPTEFREVKYA